MLNGYQNVGDAATGWYYDHERFLPFWERAEALGVPVYLHPRDPLPGNQGIYEGHPELFGAVSTFTVETAHALRLMTSGLFDRFPGSPSSSAIWARPCRSTSGASTTACPSWAT